MAVQQEVVQLPSTLGPPGRGRGAGNHLSATSDHALFTQLPRKQTHTPQATGQPRPPETNGRPGFSNLLRILPQGRPLQVSPLLPECRNSLVTLHGQPGVVVAVDVFCVQRPCSCTSYLLWKQNLPSGKNSLSSCLKGQALSRAASDSRAPPCGASVHLLYRRRVALLQTCAATRM